MSLDLLDVVPGANAGFEFELLDAKGDPSGSFVTVLGTDSDETRKRLDDLTKHRVNKMFRGGQFRANAVASPEEDRSKNIEIAAAATKSWRNVKADGGEQVSAPVLELRGKSYDCTFENAKFLYTTLPYMFDQINAQASNRANFVKGA